VGALKHRESDRRTSLGPRSLVGRAEACVVRLESRRASGEHAVVFWDGEHWYARDLGSRNGTTVDGRRLPVGERGRLGVGSTVSFGDEAEIWELDDAGPPGPSARAEPGGEIRTAEYGLLALPSAADPRVTLFEDRRGRWMVEIDGETRLAVDQERIEAGGVFRLSVPPTADAGALPTTTPLTSHPMLIGTTVLRFEVSRDGEYVALSLVHGDAVTPLGGRVYHDVLLLLAKARLRDREARLPAGEQGWLYIDDVLSMLKIDLRHLNTNVFRVRQHLAKTGVLDVGALIERRATTRQIRLGTDAVEIVAP
jgi:FHA domain